MKINSTVLLMKINIRRFWYEIEESRESKFGSQANNLDPEQSTKVNFKNVNAQVGRKA